MMSPFVVKIESGNFNLVICSCTCKLFAFVPKNVVSSFKRMNNVGVLDNVNYLCHLLVSLGQF